MPDDGAELTAGSGDLLVSQDPALAGMALAGGTADSSLAERSVELLQAGGPVVAILVAMSVAALAMVFLKLWQFHAVRLGDTGPAREAAALCRQDRLAEALTTAERSRNPAAQTLARALRGKRRGLDEAQVREEVVRYGNDVLAALRGWFRPLETIASLAPLLGLFGTVLGMIAAFRQLELAGNQVNPAILSGGIWEALLTTAVGLAVAIPVVAALNWLERKVDRLAHEMDDLATQVFTQDLSGAETAETRNIPTHDRVATRSPVGAAGD